MGFLIDQHITETFKNVIIFVDEDKVLILALNDAHGNTKGVLYLSENDTEVVKVEANTFGNVDQEV